MLSLKQTRHIEDKDSISFYWSKFSFHNFRFIISPASYFDERAMISFSFFFFSLYIHLPIYSGIDDCDYPEYGFYLGGDNAFFNHVVWCWKMKKKFFYMPWSYDWVRTSHLLKDQQIWEHEYKGNKKDFWKTEWKEKLFQETHDYTYRLDDDQIQAVKATIGVREMEWRPRWFKWTSLFARVRRSIDVEFNKEVGEEAGSWKGGVLGCGWNMLPGETPIQTLRRMEKQRKFK